MEYQKITIKVADEAQTEMLIALLSEEGCEGFEELPKQLIAYTNPDNNSLKNIAEIMAQFQVEYSLETIAKTNWNEIWESNFQPVIVEDFCTVRADFHNMEIATPYEIIITPKMSFGTGHHATTQQMISQMKDMDFLHKKVFDFGTGTGILAILAAKLGASEVTANDNDEWCVLNAVENMERNKVAIDISLRAIEDFSTSRYDILLANINRNILLQYMNLMSEMTVENGYVLMSGLLVEDEEIIVDSASPFKLVLIKKTEQSNWISLLFQKIK